MAIGVCKCLWWVCEFAMGKRVIYRRILVFAGANTRFLNISLIFNWPRISTLILRWTGRTIYSRSVEAFQAIDSMYIELTEFI